MPAIAIDQPPPRGTATGLSGTPLRERPAHSSAASKAATRQDRLTHHEETTESGHVMRSGLNLIPGLSSQACMLPFQFPAFTVAGVETSTSSIDSHSPATTRATV